MEFAIKTFLLKMLISPLVFEKIASEAHDNCKTIWKTSVQNKNELAKFQKKKRTSVVIMNSTHIDRNQLPWCNRFCRRHRSDLCWPNKVEKRPRNCFEWLYWFQNLSHRIRLYRVWKVFVAIKNQTISTNKLLFTFQVDKKKLFIYIYFLFVLK